MTQVAYFALKHKVEPSEALARRLIEEAIAFEDILPQMKDPKHHDHWIATMKREKFASGIPAYMYARKTALGGTNTIQLGVALYQGTWDLGRGRIIRLKPFMAEPKRWVTMWGGPTGLNPEVDADAAWFLARATPLIPIFEPTFGFADTRERVIKNIGDDPAKVAWPLMIFGPEMVKEIGRERLLESPAWHIEELSYGGIWVQAWENPFSAPAKFVAALADHLGLQQPER